MSKIQSLRRLAFGLAFIVFAAGFHAAVAQSELTGDWKATVKTEEPDKISLSFELRAEKGGTSQMASSYDYAQLQGLSREQALSGGPVRFSLAREAGTIDCEGSFQNGRGSGTFRFTANPSFGSAI